MRLLLVTARVGHSRVCMQGDAAGASILEHLGHQRPILRHDHLVLLAMTNQKRGVLASAGGNLRRDRRGPGLLRVFPGHLDVEVDRQIHPSESAGCSLQPPLEPLDYGTTFPETRPEMLIV